MNNAERNNDEDPAEHDDLIAVPTDVLAAWVTDTGRCVWEATVGEVRPWSGVPGIDRARAAGMCAGCPVLAECLELEQRADEGFDPVDDALHPADRVVLHEMWAARTWSDIAIVTADGGERA